MYQQQPFYQNPYQNPYQNYQQRLDAMTSAPTRYSILHVNGRGGVDALQMSPNSEVIALDDTAPMVWLITTDGAGYKTPTAFDITRHVDKPPVDVSALEGRLSRVEEALNELQSDARTAPKRTTKPASERATEQ